MTLITQDKAKAYDPKTTEQRADVLKGLFALSPEQKIAMSSSTKADFLSLDKVSPVREPADNG